jgi:hypothetical protein
MIAGSRYTMYAETDFFLHLCYEGKMDKTLPIIISEHTG